jgi:beta-glucosidase-like glycosyl hydrolase
VTFPLLANDRDELKSTDIVPFGAGIEAGADAVMVGHIAPRGSALPASLDRDIIMQLLREECRFEGVVMTDALEMAGAWMIAHGVEDRDAVQRDLSGRERDLSDVLRLALEAGNDLLLFARPVGRLVMELESCLSGIDGSDPFWHGRFREISAASLERIGKLRGDAGSGIAQTVSEAAHGEPYREAAKRSIEMIRDPRSLVPFSAEEETAITFLGLGSDFRNEVVGRFVASVKEGFSGSGRALDSGAGFTLEDLERLRRREHPGEGAGIELCALRAGAPGAREILFLLNRKPMTAADLATFAADAAVVVVCGWPYAPELLPPGTTVLVTYGIYDGLADEIVRRLLPKTD